MKFPTLSSIFTKHRHQQKSTPREPDFWDTLHESNWKKASYPERLDALQELENYYAARQGRDPISINYRFLNNNSDGYTEQEGNKLWINEKWVYDRNPYRAVECVIHEGKHLQQIHISENEQTDESLLWKVNFGKGYLYDQNRPDYRLQPIEADAYQYAQDQLTEIYQTRLQPRYGKNKEFSDYYKQLEQEESIAIKTAIHLYGPNYQEVLQKKIRDKEQLITRYEQAHQRVVGDSRKLGPYLHQSVEDYLHHLNGQTPSFQKWKQTFEQDPVYQEAQQSDNAFQDFNDLFKKTYGRYHPPEHPVGDYLADFSEPYTMDHFELYAELANKDFKNYLDQRKTEHAQFMEEFQAVYGQDEQGEVWRVFGDHIEQHLYWQTGQNPTVFNHQAVLQTEPKSLAWLQAQMVPKRQPTVPHTTNDFQVGAAIVGQSRDMDLVRD